MTFFCSVERHQPDAERERRGLAVGRDHGLREVGRHRVEQRAHGVAVLGRVGRAEEVGQRERRAQRGLAAAVLGRVAVALEQARLVVAHPLHDGRVGEVLALDDDVDLPRHAGRPLQRVEVARAAQILRHQLAQVGADLRLRVDRQPGQRDHEPDQQHALRALEPAAQHALPHPPAEPPQRSPPRAPPARRSHRPARRRRAPTAPAPPRSRAAAPPPPAPPCRR